MKIIQILFAPNDSTWQGKLLGVGDDGVVYAATENTDCPWVVFAKPSYGEYASPQVKP